MSKVVILRTDFVDLKSPTNFYIKSIKDINIRSNQLKIGVTSNKLMLRRM